MLLNVGCGDLRAPSPWINLDSQESVRPDVVADARDIPFRSETVDRIYCGHVLEHLSYEQGVPSALREMRRVLKPGGQLAIVGPDYHLAEPLGDDILLIAIKNGACRWEGDEHLWLSTGPATYLATRQVFPRSSQVDPATLTEWPVAFQVPWQFAISARKE